MRLSSCIKFQKTLALAASASNPFEAEAAELAARRVMEQQQIDPTRIPNTSLYSQMNFAENVLLQKLRAEWLELHPLPVKIAKSKTWEQSPSIPFNLNRFSKHTQKRRRHPQMVANKVIVTPEMLEKIHTMLQQGTLPSNVRRAFGLTKGQIAGIKGRYDERRRMNRDVQDSNYSASPVAAAGDAGDGGERQA
jgi:hypothetical protein